MPIKVTAIVPARCGSKSIPHKNVMSLGGHPLIAYTIAAARLSSIIDNIIVTTDCQEIAEAAQRYGAVVPFLRPKEIAQDSSTDIEFFRHYIDFCKKSGAELGEYLVHLRPTTPFREISVLDEAISYILANPKATSLRSVNPTQLSPYKVFRMKGKYLKGFFPNDPRPEYYNLPRQVFPSAFVPNGYVDVVRTSVIETGTLHGESMLAYVTSKVPDVDTIEDCEYAKAELKNESFEELIMCLGEYK